MKQFFAVLGWSLAVVFFVLFLLGLFSGHYLASIPIVLAILILVPPVRRWLIDDLRIPLPVWLRAVLVPVCFFLFIYLIFAGMGNAYSIYRDPGIKQKLMEIYDRRMSEWPVPYESKYLETGYGRVHVIISGPEKAPAIILLHASAMASWSWLYNIEGLDREYRTYCIDTIGDAGRSVLKDVTVFPADGRALAELYGELMDQLHIGHAVFIGASQGGFIATNMALYAPARVDRLILCGPMGYTGTTGSVLRILFTTMFPLKPIQESATRWAFGDDPVVNRAVGEWFRTIMEGVISRQARPTPFTPEQLQKITMPVLMLLGKRDGLVGDPDDSRALVKNFPAARIEVLDTGHLISAEQPVRFNDLVTGFLSESENRKP